MREAIAAAVQAHGAGKILPKEMPISKDTRLEVIRHAPTFLRLSAYQTHQYHEGSPDSGLRPYTVDALAKFLGFVKSSTQKPTNSFEASFGAEELIADGVMKESQIKGLSAERLGESLQRACRIRKDYPRGIGASSLSKQQRTLE